MYIREKFYNKLPAMPDAISMDVTEVAQWYLRDDECMNHPWEELPSLVPPFQDLWMEFVYPRQFRSDRGLMTAPHFLQSCGLLLRASEIAPEHAASIRGRHYDFLFAAMDKLTGDPAPNRINVDGDTDSDAVPRWLVYGQTVVASKQQMQLVNLWTMTLDEGGRFIRHVATPLPWGLLALANDSSAQTAFDAYNRMGAEDRRYWLEGVRDEFEPPFLYSLSVLHCRNIEIVERPAPPAPILKQRAKKTIPYFQYKILQVPALHAARTQGPARGGEPEPKALHFVRGHFKDFSAKGLFGKYKGVYWWGDQVRGDSALGVIDKDYKLARN